MKTKGFVALISRTLLFLKRRLFVFKNLYLYEHTLQERNEADYIPKIQGYTLKVVSSNRQADEIANEGFEDFRDCPVIVNTRRCLDKGAIAFCFFVGREFAHIGFVAMDEEAKKSFDILPYRVDFSHGQACTGGTVTMPKYRGNGLMAYGYFKRLEFLREKGYKTSRNAVAADSKIAQRVHAKFSPRIYARARFLKIVRWIFWKETPLAAP
ncbi:hypothetical protein ACFLYS_03910 [Chloroflexota bacterium]